MQTEYCPQCQGPLRAPGAECPACLLGLGVAAGIESQGETSVGGAPPLDADPVGVGARIGPYTIVRRLGEGGMGVVYLAEQNVAPRQVAVKVIKLGMDTRTVVARFEAERRALALMSHPGVARAHEAGETPAGRPYFAMEYVDGEPITVWADRRRLSPRERVALFLRVCEAIQHAHQRGIIHRDIKPSNVLVTQCDGEAVPKVIDFGVAKAVGQRLNERSMFTELGVLVGTPAYMSPEQSGVELIDVDTRSDVYSLGVLLYELLTGALPFDSRGGKGSTPDEMRRRVREERPSKPSVRLGQLGDTGAQLAERRRSDPRGLARQLAGELDLITMKALEKEPDRRYGSPAELAADLQRHLDDEPVLARPPSLPYQLRKLIRRHRWESGFGCVALVALIVFAVAMGVLYRRAVAAEAELAREAEVSRRVSDFLVSVFEVPDPMRTPGKDITARELLDTGAQRIDAELRDQPIVRAELTRHIATTYLNLGAADEAVRLGERARRTLLESTGADDPRTLDAASLLAVSYRTAGRPEDSEALLRETLERQRQVLGPEHRDTLGTLGNLCLTLAERGRFDEAEAACREGLEGELRQFGPDDLQPQVSRNNLANVLRNQSRFDEASELLRASLPVQRQQLGDDHPDTMMTEYSLAMLEFAAGRIPEAETAFHDLIERRTRILGEDHPFTFAAINGLAVMYAWMGRHEESAEQFQQLIALNAARPNHPRSLMYKGNLALAYSALNRLDEAEALFVENVAAKSTIHGADHPITLETKGNLASLYHQQNRFDDAEALFVEALTAQRATLGTAHVQTLRTMANLSRVYRARGETDRAAALMEETLAGQEELLGRDNVQTNITAHNLASLYAARGEPGDDEAADELFGRAQSAWDQALGPQHPHAILNLRSHAKLLRLMGRDDDAQAKEDELARRQEESERANAAG